MPQDMARIDGLLAATSTGDGPLLRSVRDALATQLAAIPDGKRAALVGHVDLTTGIMTIGLAARLGSGWSLAADADLVIGEKVGGKVLVMKTW